MSAPWIRIEIGLSGHFKTRNVATMLGIPRQLVVGILIDLWGFTLSNAWRDADLEPFGVAGIEEACGWTGERGHLVDALRTCGRPLKNGEKGPGFIDNFVVHDWLDRAGKIVKDRLYREQEDQERNVGRGVVPEVLIRWNEYAEMSRLLPATERQLERTRGSMTLERLESIIKAISAQPFLLGNSRGGWKVTLPWLFNPENAEKVLTMQYAQGPLAVDKEAVKLDKAVESDHERQRETDAILERRRSHAKKA